jgi:hypothetical protein
MLQKTQKTSFNFSVLRHKSDSPLLLRPSSSMDHLKQCMTTLQAVINDNFLDRVAALHKGEKRQGKALTNALSGNANEEDQVVTSIRAGSQMYARALTGINFGISFLNFARSDLAQVGKLAEEMVGAVERAASRKGSRNDRLQAQRVIQENGQAIKTILRGAEVGDREYLTGEGIKEVFSSIGLDPDRSRSLEDIFKNFVSLDKEENLIDPAIKGEDSPIPRELGKPKSTHSTGKLFDGSRSLTKAADAYAMLDDLKAFSAQVQQNLVVVDELAVVLEENAFLARSTAVAFLKIQDSIGSAPEASTVARRLERMIQRDARAALSQAENLEPMIVATLTYKDSGIVVDGGS